MASYEFRIPSKAVPYGYVNKNFEGDFTDDEIGLMYARAVRALWIAEAGDLDKPAPKVEAQPTKAEPDEVSQADAEEAVKSELGGVETTNAWDEDAPEVKKVWENPPAFDF